MQSVYERIFFFSGGYNYLHAQVCTEFRALSSKKTRADYLDQLIQDGKDVSEQNLEFFLDEAIEKELIHLVAECSKYTKQNISLLASKKGKLKVLQWAHEHGHPCDVNVCEKAAKHGHLQILKWAIQGVDWGAEVCLISCSKGHLEILKWEVEENKRKLSPWFFSNAAWGGHVEILRWLREKGCPEGNLAYHNAMQNGKTEAVKWLRG